MTRLGMLLLLTGLWCSSAYAQEVRVDWIANQAAVQKDRVVVRAAFDITGPPHRWYTVYFHLALDRTVYLELPKSKKMVHMWGHLFTPANVRTARWTQIQDSFTFGEISKATNLPKGKRTRVWAVFNVWDHRARKYVNNGWVVRSELFVTTDGRGKVKSVEVVPPRFDKTAKDLAGTWKLAFPDGKSTGECTMTEKGRWSWKILPQGNRLKMLRSAGSFQVSAEGLTLTPDGKKAKLYKVDWHSARRFSIRLKDEVIHFRR